MKTILSIILFLSLTACSLWETKTETRLVKLDLQDLPVVNLKPYSQDIYFHVREESDGVMYSCINIDQQMNLELIIQELNTRVIQQDGIIKQYKKYYESDIE